MKRVILLCILFLLPAAWFPCQAADPNLSNLDNTLLDQQKKMQRLQKGIEGQRALVKETRKKEESLLSELDAIETRLKQERFKLKDLQASLELHENMIIKKQQELVEAQAAKGTVRDHVEQRLAAYYRMGPLGMLNVIFSAQSLPELLNFDEYFQHLLKYDKQLVGQYREKITLLSDAQTAMEREKKDLVTAITGLKEQEQRLAGTRHERANLLKRVKTEKKLYQRALEEIEEAAENLTATMEKLKKEATERKKAQQKATRVLPKKQRPAEWSPFAAQKGRLDPPVSGTVTTQFGKNTKGKFGITTVENGIDIKTESGARIRAIHDGKVVYAGILRGYGNIIIIDHGDHYYSLMSRLAELHKKEGDDVGRGEVIGTMSDQEGLLNEGLHFEIRHGTTPENPLHWVNNAKLKITSGRR